MTMMTRVDDRQSICEVRPGRGAASVRRGDIGAWAGVCLAAGLAGVSTPAMGQMVLTPEATRPTAAVSLFSAIGTANTGNQKARLEGKGVTTLQGGNPMNGFWYNQSRSWEALWNHSAGTVTFNVFNNNAWSGSPVMSMTRTPATPAEGSGFSALSLGVRNTISGAVIDISNVQFDGGGGFAPVPGMNGSFPASSALAERVFSLSGSSGPGVTGDFRLRGVTHMSGGTTTGDSMRFIIQGIEAPVPSPGSLALLGAGAFLTLRRHRR